MGWETNVPVMLSFNKETYSDEYQVKNKIEEIKKYIAEYKENLIIYAMGNPKDFIEEGESVISFKNIVKDTIECMEEEIIQHYRHELLLENFKCRGGDFVENPEYEKSIKEWMEESYINGNIEYYNNQESEE